MMRRQIEIIGEITEIALAHAEDGFDELWLEAGFSEDDLSMKLTCRTRRGRRDRPVIISEKDLYDLGELSFTLQKELKTHNGGDLKKYVVRIDETGTAKAQFEYRNGPEVSPPGQDS